MLSKICNSGFVYLLILFSGCFSSYKKEFSEETGQTIHVVDGGKSLLDDDDHSTHDGSGLAENGHYSENDKGSLNSDGAGSAKLGVDDFSLVGTWQGKEIGFYSGISLTFEFTQTAIVITFSGGATFRGSYHISNEVIPNQLDVNLETAEMSTVPVVPLPAIYKTRDDVLTIAAALPGILTRPRSFLPPDDGSVLLFELVRLP